MKGEKLSKNCYFLWKIIFSQEILGKIRPNIFKFAREILNGIEANFHLNYKKNIPKISLHCVFSFFSKYGTNSTKILFQFVPMTRATNDF